MDNERRDVLQANLRKRSLAREGEGVFHGGLKNDSHMGVCGGRGERGRERRQHQSQAV